MAEMTSRPPDRSEHSRKPLLRIAAIANILVWFALVGAGLTVFYHIQVEMQQYAFEIATAKPAANLPLDFWQMLAQNPNRMARLASKILSAVIDGAITFLILKGLALGSQMLVEIDLNQETILSEGKAASAAPAQPEDSPDAAPEDDPVLYEPQHVVRFYVWTERAAYIAVFLTVVRYLGIILSNIPLFSGMQLSAALPLLLFDLASMGVSCIMVYFPLKALALILNHLMGLEANTAPTPPGEPV